MKKKSTSQSAFFNIRVLIAAVFCLSGIAVALFGMGAFSNAFAQSRGNRTNQDAPGTQTPDVVRMVGPVRLDQDLRSLPYIPQEGETEARRLTRYPHPEIEEPAKPVTMSGSARLQALMKDVLRPTPNIPAPLLTFEAVNVTEGTCNCAPPDTNGDVSPTHYVEAVNSAFRVFDKNG